MCVYRCVLFQRPGAEECGKWVCVGECCSSGLVPRRVVNGFVWVCVVPAAWCRGVW